MDEAKATEIGKDIARHYTLVGGVIYDRLVKDIADALLSIAADEREECAKVAESFGSDIDPQVGDWLAEKIRSHPRVPSSPIEGT